LKIVYNVLAWFCMALAAVGLGGGMLLSVYLQWTTGFDSGAPFSLFAGVKFIGFILQNPLLIVLFVMGVIGAGGLAVVAPRSSYAAKR
jgi:hypothetical protein